MDYIPEIFLGFDLIILGLFVRQYISYKHYANSLNKARQLAINEDLKEYVSTHKDKIIPYVALRGTVKPIGAPIHSVLSPSATGVLQVIQISEHVVARGVAGFWTDQNKLIDIATNQVPFKLCNDAYSVEIIDALNAAVLDMDIVHEDYKPASLSIFQHIYSFFSGVRLKGVQTTEQLLREDSFITAIGELQLNGNKLQLQPSTQCPLFLTTATRATLVKRFEEAKSSTLVKIIVCGAISAVIIGFILRKWDRKRKENPFVTVTSGNAGRSSRARARPKQISQDQACVVCWTNPKEIIILPCGHVCLCENCAEHIGTTCPICRRVIALKAAAFIA